MRQGILTATFPLSGTTTGDVDLRGGPLRAIYVPKVTSGDMFVRGSFDQTSANFGRLQYPIFGAPASGDLRLPTGPGSLMIMWPSNLPSPNYVRFESAVSQASAAVLSVQYGRN